MKKLLLVVTLALAGCQSSMYQTVSVQDVGIAQEVSYERQNGDLKFVPGPGLVYTAPNNQCGKNCDKHRELAAQIEREKAQVTPRADYVRAVNREKAMYARQERSRECANLARDKFLPVKQALEESAPELNENTSFEQHLQQTAVYNKKMKSLKIEWLKFTNKCEGN